jgi:hypothetical protein
VANIPPPWPASLIAQLASWGWCHHWCWGLLLFAGLDAAAAETDANSRSYCLLAARETHFGRAHSNKRVCPRLIANDRELQLQLQLQLPATRSTR